MERSSVFLGVEAGGTRTSALLVNEEKTLFLGAFGQGNVRLLDDAALAKLFRCIRDAVAAFPTPSAIALGMAGARSSPDQTRVVKIAATLWPRSTIHVGTDLDVALAAAQPTRSAVDASVLVLSGTGSCCFGRNASGHQAKIGGGGHLLGDKGSGYHLGLAALQAVLADWDRNRQWGLLGQSLLAATQLNEPEDLFAWAQSSQKQHIAKLAEVVFRTASSDKLAKAIIRDAARSLASDALIVANRLAAKGRPVQFVFAGSVLLKGTRLAREVAGALRRNWPSAIIDPLQRPSVWGAIEIARKARSEAVNASPLPVSVEKSGRQTSNATSPLSPTEQRHPASMRLDRLPIESAVELFLKEDARITAGLLAEKRTLSKVVGWVANSFKQGGRLFYVGAGTSGRLGILDASECPPTFRTPPELVQGIIAGGREAVWSAVEGAEDDSAAGAQAIRFRGISDKDVVVGIAASGRTPFVRGALLEAKRRGARTALLCFNPHVHAERPKPADVVIAPDIGPELLTGSTRLKSGTATKLVLNIFTTLAMVRTGKVIGNLMVDVNPSNVKLRGRAIRIVRELTGVDEATAKSALEAEGWTVRQAWLRLGGQRKRKSTAS